MSTKAGRRLAFFPHPTHERLVADPKRAGDAPRAHAVLVGREHLILGFLVVARPGGLHDEGALAVQALGPLRSVAGVAVLADAFAPTPGTNMDDGRGEHP